MSDAAKLIRRVSSLVYATGLFGSSFSGEQMRTVRREERILQRKIQRLPRRVRAGAAALAEAPPPPEAGGRPDMSQNERALGTDIYDDEVARDLYLMVSDFCLACCYVHSRLPSRTRKTFCARIMAWHQFLTTPSFPALPAGHGELFDCLTTTK